MLSAGNVFAQFVGALDQAGDVEHIPITIAPNKLGVINDKAFLGFQAQSRGDGSFDPAVVQIRDSEGLLVTPDYAVENLSGSADSVMVARLGEGNYTLEVSGTVEERSQYQVNVFLVGDVNGDHTVGQSDLNSIQQMYGAMAGDDRYQLGADANLDGRINAIDLVLARRNEVASQPTNNVFAKFTGTLDMPNDTEQIPVSVALDSLGITGDTAFLGFQSQSRGGGGFDATILQICNTDGQLVTPDYAVADLPGSTDSVVVAALGNGDYTLEASGALAAGSKFQVNVFLVGDVNGDRVVAQDDLDAIRHMYGASTGDDRYQLAADANLDGRINAIDLALARRNQVASQSSDSGDEQSVSEGAVVTELGSEDSSSTWGDVYDRVSAVTPTDGFATYAAMQFFESEEGWVQPLPSTEAPQGGVLFLPVDPTVIVDWFYRNAGYGNSLVVYQVDGADAHITIDGVTYYVDDPQYPAKAALRAIPGATLVSPNGPNHDLDLPDPHQLELDISEGTYISYYVIQGTISPYGAQGYKWFPFSEANVDDYQHFQQVQPGDQFFVTGGATTYKVEDLHSGGGAYNPGGFTNDFDFNDVVFSVDVPILPISGPSSIDEGSEYTLTLGNVYDPQAGHTSFAYKIIWGDGTVSLYDTSNPLPESRQATHVYGDGDAERVIAVNLIDNWGEHVAVATQNVTVHDVAPEMSVSGNSTIDEGSFYTLTLGSVDDTDEDTVTTYTVDWGDELLEYFSSDQVAARGRQLTHRYADGPANPTITVSLTNEDGIFVMPDQPSVTVDNITPTASLGNNGPVDEGSTAIVTFSDLYDPEGPEQLRFSFDFSNDGIWDVGDGTYAGSSEESSAVTSTVVSPLVVRGRVYDKDGAYSEYFTEIAVLEAFGGPDVVNEDIQHTFVLGTHSSGQDPIDSYTVHWDDGSDPETFVPAEIPGWNGEVTHTYMDASISPTVLVDVVVDGVTYENWTSKSLAIIPAFPVLSCYPDVVGTFVQSDGTSSLAVEDESRQHPCIIGFGDSSVGDNYVISGDVMNTAWAELGFFARGDMDAGFGYILSLDPISAEFKLAKLTPSLGPITLSSHTISGLTVELDDQFHFVFDVNCNVLIGKLYDSSGAWLDTITAVDGTYTTGVVGTWAKRLEGPIEGNWSNMRLTASSASFFGPDSVEAGSAYAITLLDPTPDGTIAHWIVDWGDGTDEVFDTDGQKTHVYADGPADRIITVNMLTEDDNYMDAGSLHVAVAMVAESQGTEEGNELPTSPFDNDEFGYSPEMSGPSVDWFVDITSALHGEAAWWIQDGELSLVNPVGGITVVNAGSWESAARAAVSGTVHIKSFYFTFPTSNRFLVDTAYNLHSHSGYSLLDGYPNGYSDGRGGTLQYDTKLIVLEDLGDNDFDDDYWVVRAHERPTLAGDSSIAEGAPYTLYFTWQNESPPSGAKYTIHWGDGSTNLIKDNLPSGNAVTHVYDGAGNYAITVDITYADGMQVSGIAKPGNVSVSNVPPSITINGNSEAYEGSPYMLSLSPITDVGWDTVTTAVIEWGEGDNTTLNATGIWFRNLDNDHLFNDTVLTGVGAVGYTPLSGDWNGDGKSERGLYDSSTNTWYLDINDNGSLEDTGEVISYGIPGDVPVVGDWDSNGTDTIGLYRPSLSTFCLRNVNDDSNSLITPFQYGPAGCGWTPIAGDWDGNGTDTVGLYNPSTSVFHLKNSHTSGTADITFCYGPANAGWKPIIGDWDGDGGGDTIGLYNPTTSAFYLRNANGPRYSGEPMYADESYAYGLNTIHWTPIAGDFNGDNRSEVGLYVFGIDTYSNDGQVSFTYSDGPVSRTIYVNLTDEDDTYTHVASKSITVNNVAPTASHGGPYAINEGQSLVLNGSATDPGNDSLTYAWDLDNDGYYDDATGAAPTLTWTQVAALGLPSNGTARSIHLKVTDSDGAQSTAANTTLTISNLTPTASHGGPYAINEGQSLVLNGSATDPGNDSLTYAWDLDNDGYYDDATGAAPTLTWTQVAALGLPSNGTAQSIHLKVTDSDGAQSSAADTTLTISNLPPTVNASGPYAINQGQSLTLNGVATDPGNDTLSYTWDLNNDGTYGDATGATPTLTWTQVAALGLPYNGTPQPIHLKVTDSDSAQMIADTTLAINSAGPTVNSGGPYSITEGNSLVLAGSASGNAPLTYTWDLNNDGTYGDATGATPTLTWAQVATLGLLSNGTAQFIHLKVTDNYGTTTIADTTLTVNNVAPTASHGGPYAINEGQSLVLNGSATDPGNDSLTYAWDLDNDGQYDDATGAAPTLTWAQVAALGLPSDGTAQNIHLKATDSDGAVSAAANTTLTISNVAPTASHGGPYAINEGQSLVLNGSATDLGGDSLTYAWDLDNDGQYDDATGAALTLTWAQVAALGLASDGTAQSIHFKATDSDGAQSSAANTTLTISNLAPTASHGGPYAINEGQSLVLNGSATDPGGDSLTYAWDLDNDGYYDDATDAAPTLTWAQVAALGLPTNGTAQPIYLKVTDSDGTQSSAAYTTLTISNVAPTVNAGGPYTINEGEGLTFDASGVDPGNDTLTYVWDLDNDGYYDDATGAAPTLTWAQVAALGLPSDGTAQTIHVYATDSDGLQSSADDTTLTISNVVPTADAGGPYTITEGEGLTLDGAGADQGNDTLTYAWDLDNDGYYDDATGAVPTLTWEQVAAVRQSTDHSPHTIRIAVTDSDSGWTSDDTTLTILNAAPTVTIDGPDTADEGDTEHYTFTTSDLGENSAFSLVSINATNGDVSNQQFNTTTGSGSFDVTFHDGPATSTISVQVQDSDGAPSTMLEPFVVTVSNVAPQMDVYGDDAYEGSVYTLTLGAVSDPAGEYDTVQTYQIDWGDGWTDSYKAEEIEVLGRHVSHTYADGTIGRTIVVCLWDEDSHEGYVVAEKNITVFNVAPTVSVNNATVTVNEGTTATNTGTFGDVGADTVEITASVGNVSQNDTLKTWNWSYTPADGPDDSQTVTITATDSDGLPTITTFGLVVNNVPPQLTISGDPLAEGGEEYTLTLSEVNDPAGELDAIQTYRIRWGDGVVEEYVTDYAYGEVLLPSSREVTHTYQEGPRTLTIIVDLIDEDGEYLNVASKQIGVTSDPDNNAAPYFTSTQITEASVGETYYYESRASDPENDRLTFAVGSTVIWPDGFTPTSEQEFSFTDAETELTGGGWHERGIYEWNPPAELAGQTVTIIEIVTDSAENEVSRPLNIYINPMEGNHDPMIVSQPPTEHWLPIPPTASSDPVDPTSLSFCLDEDQSASFQVSIDLLALNIQDNNVVGADIIFLVDDSGSMRGAHAWLEEVVVSIETELQLRGFTDNQYGLVRFGAGNPMPQAIGVGSGGAPFGTATQLATAIATSLNRSGSVEDGYLAIDYALSEYTFRSNAIANFVLITDEPRNFVNGYSENFTFSSVLYGDSSHIGLLQQAELTTDDVTLHAVIAGDLYADDAIDDVGNSTEFTEVQGTWSVEPLAYTGESNSSDLAALSIVADTYTYKNSIESSITIADSTSGGGEAFVIFDYVDVNDYKFAGLDTSTDQWIIGAFDTSGWHYYVRQSSDIDLAPDKTYEIAVDFEDDKSIILSVDGLEVASYDYGSGATVVENLAGVGVLDAIATFGFYRISDMSILRFYGGFATYFGGSEALGVDYDHKAYLPDGSGGYLLGIRGEYPGWDTSTWRQYTLLAWQTLGSVWDIGLLRDTEENDPIRQSFSTAFVDVVGDRLEERRPIHLVVDEEGIEFSYQTIEPGEYLVTFTGDGLAHNFDLEFQTGFGTVVSAIPVAVNGAYIYELEATDPDGDTPLYYEWTAGSDSHGAQLTPDGEDPNRAVITWNPTEPGDYDFSMTVRDGYGGISDPHTWTVTVSEDGAGLNTEPDIIETSVPDAQVRRSWTYQVEATDGDSDHLRYYLIDNDIEGMHINRNTGVVTWTPGLNQDGIHTFWVLVSDGRGGEAVEDFTVTVDPQTPVNRLPEIHSDPPVWAFIDEEYIYAIDASDPDGDPLTYELTVKPEGMGITPEKGVIGWTPREEDLEAYESVFVDGYEVFFVDVVVLVNDGQRGITPHDFTLQVVAPNQLPAIDSKPCLEMGVGEYWSYQIVASDPNGDELKYYLHPYCEEVYGMSMSEEIPGLVEWTPQTIGNYQVLIAVDDGRGEWVYQEFVLSVYSAAPPRIEGSVPKYWMVGEEQSASFKVIAVEEIDDLVNDVTLDENSYAKGMSLTAPSSGTYNSEHDWWEYDYELNWTPQNAGAVTVYITAEDGVGAIGTGSVDLEAVPWVNPTVPPEITDWTFNPDGPAIVDQLWTCTMTGLDPDQGTGNPDPTFELITFQVNGTELPSEDYSFTDGQDGTATLQWTPESTDVGTAYVEVVIVDWTGAYTPYGLYFDVVSSVSNEAPTFVTHAWGPAYVGQLWTYEAQATDPDGDDDALTYELDYAYCPADMHLEVIDDAVRGRYARITWVPEEPTDPSTLGQHVVINVSDGTYTVPDGFYLPVVASTAENDPPEFLTQYLGPMVKDCTFQFQLNVEDPNGHDFTVALTDTMAPGFTSANITSDGYIEWTPTTGGDFTITLTATDEYGYSRTVTYPIHVFDNADPVIERDFAPPAFLGETYEYSMKIWDPNPEDTIEVTLNSEAIAKDLDIVYQGDDIWTLTWDLTDLDTPGEYLAAYGSSIPDAVPVTIHVEDNHGRYVNLHFPILPVYDPNDPNSPQVPDEDLTISAGRKFEYQVVVQSGSGRSLTYTLLPDETPVLPDGIKMTTDGFITWTPTIEQAGEVDGGGILYELQVLVDDGTTTPAAMDLNILVLRPEDFEAAAPTINSLPPNGATAGQELVYEPTAVIVVDEQTIPVTSGLRWYLTAKPDDTMQIDRNTGRITWTPSVNYIGQSGPVEIYVVDSSGLSGTQAFTLTVGGVNQKPTIDAMFPKTCRAEIDFDYDVLASDPEGHALSYELQMASDPNDPLPSGLFMDSETGHIHWDGEYVYEDTYEFVVKVSEKHYLSSSVERPFTLNVIGNGVNCEPLILGAPDGQYATVGQLFSYQFSAFDLDTDNQGFTWDIAGGDLGDHMSIDANGLFTWTPLENEKGRHTITVSLRDDPLTNGFPITTYVSFELEAFIDNSPEVDATAEVETVAGAWMEYQVEAYDPEDPTGKSMSFAIDYDNIVVVTQGLSGWDVPGPDELAIWRDSGLLIWQVPQDLQLDEPYDAVQFEVPIIVTGKLGAQSTQILTINASQEDTIAPTISTRLVEAEVYSDGSIENIIRTVLPGEELDANIDDIGRAYVLIVDIADNSGELHEDNEEGEWSSITVMDVATLELPNEYYAPHAALEYGYTTICFTLGADGQVGGTGINEDGLNQGNIHFKIVVTDNADTPNTTTCQFTYYVRDYSDDPPAKLLELHTRDNEDTLGEDEVITAPVNVYGIANMADHTYELLLYRADGDYCEVVPLLDENQQQMVSSNGNLMYVLAAQSDYVLLDDGYANVVSDDPNNPLAIPASPLGMIDPTLYGSGMYRLVLAIICDCGGHHYHAVDERIIEIRNDVKPSSLDLSFTDLQVDLGGIPISLVRSYSSTEVELGQGDFGPGWSLGILNAGIQVAHFDKATNSLQEPMASGTRVLVTLPDGSIQRFSFAPEQVGQSGQYKVHFEPDQDVTSTFEIAGLGGQLLLAPLADPDGGSYKGTYVVPNTNQNFIPYLFGNAFVLRTQAGLEYLYDMQTGDLIAIRDDTGRRVDITREEIEEVDTTKIIACTGTEPQVIIITRDDEGRIDEIKDPSGQSITYAYGDYTADGVDHEDDYYTGHNVLPPEKANLGMVTFRDGSTAVYRYQEYLDYDGDPNDPPPAQYAHHLTDIYDNAEVLVLTAEYLDGHLIELKDAGNQGADLSSRSLGGGKTLVTVTDDQGMVVEEIRNSRGDVLRRIQALDSQDDDVAPEDRRYLVTIYRYNMSGRLTAESIPLVVTGNDDRLMEDKDLIESEDYGDEITWARTLTYVPDTGLVKTTKDALDNTTVYDYDEQNRLVATTDPAGNVTHNIYDPYTGNLKETYVTSKDSSDTKFNHIRYEYVSGLLTKTYHIDTEGNETLLSETEYDDYGRVETSKDVSGIARYYVYDYNGNQTLTYYHWEDPNDGDAIVDMTIVSRMDYDLEGRVVTTAQYEISGEQNYTSAGQLDSETALWTTLTSYDNGNDSDPSNDRGYVYSSTDRLGLTSYNVYDVRGNVIETRTEAEDELGNAGWLVNRALYDAQGRVEFTTDSKFILASDYLVDDGLWYGTRNVYDKLGRTVRTERYEGIEIQLTVNAQGIGQTSLPTNFDWDDDGTWNAEAAKLPQQNETFYTELGRVDYTVDEYGTEAHYTYDPLGRLLESRYQSKDENDVVQWIATRTYYDALGRPWITSDPFILESDGSMPAWTGTQTTYDSLGRAVMTERLEGLVIDITDPADPTWMATGVVWSTETIYNSLGQVSESIGRHASQGDSESDAAYSARLATVTTDYEYDARGRQTAQVAPVVTDELTGDLVRLRSETHYDDQDRIDYTTTNIRVVVDAEGEVLSTSYTNAQETHFQYDAYGRTVRTVYDDDSFVTQGYDEFGRKVTESYQTADGETPLVKEFDYDDYGRLTTVTLPEVYDGVSGNDQPIYEYAYDAQGNQTLIRDPLGHETRFTYDDQGRELTRTLPLGFGPDGALGGGDDPGDGSFTEQKFYDDQGRLDYEVSFEGVVTAYVYDDSQGAGGRLAQKRSFADLDAYDDGNGTPAEIVAYTYDAFGRQKEVVQDADGNLATTSDQRATENSYDDLGQLVTIASPEGTIHYEYDEVTGLQTRTWTGSAVETATTDTHYAYDALGRLVEVAQVRRNGAPVDADPDTAGDQPEVTDYIYDLLGNLDQVRLPTVAGGDNRVISDYNYDSLNRLDLLREFEDLNNNQVYDSAVDTLLAEYDYDLAANGRRSGVTEKVLVDSTLQETRIDWLYDDLGRLTREVYNSDDDDLDFVTDYVYDLVGNRLEKKTDQTPTSAEMTAYHNDAADGVADVALVEVNEQIDYAYDANDRLLTEAKDVAGTDDDRFTVYEYGAGNTGTQQTSKTVYEGLDDTGDVVEQTDYAYNLQGRMSQATVDADGDGEGAAVVTDYAYDADGIRINQTEDGVKTVYLYDSQNPTGYAQILEEKDASGNVTKTYTLGHDVIAQQDSANGVLYLLYDGHGSTRSLVNATTGQLLSDQIYCYDAFGNRLDDSVALTSLLYSGEQTDSTGLQYLRARYYDSNTGQFNTLDPFAGNMNDPQSLHKYLYTHNDPINSIDPTGQFAIAELLASIALYGEVINSAAGQLTFGPLQIPSGRTDYFYDAVRELGQYDTPIPATEQLLRANIVKAALLSNIGFGNNTTKHPSYFNKSFWRSNQEGDYVVRDGYSACCAIADVWFRGNSELWNAKYPTSPNPNRIYLTGCKQAVQMTIMMGVILTCYDLDVREGNGGPTKGALPFPENTHRGQFDKLFKNGAWPSGDFQTSEYRAEGFSLADIRPGDRVFVKNPNYKKGMKRGWEGSNTIYVGGGRFIGLKGEMYEGLDGLFHHVESFAGKCKDLKITSLYRPILPPGL